MFGGLGDRTILAWTVPGLTPRYRVSLHKHSIKQILVAPDGSRALTVAWNDQPRLIDTATGRALIQLFGSDPGRDPVALSPDWRHLATVGEGRALELWRMIDHDWSSAEAVGPPPRDARSR